jgi:hypothetical protein
MKGLKVVILVTVFLLCGCAKQASVTYYSNPTGAEILENGRHLGYAPLELVYRWIPNDDNKCLTPKTITALWSSGASATNEKKWVVVCDSGSYAAAVIERPDDVPKVEDDLAFARRLQEDRMREQYRRSVENNAANAEINAALIGIAPDIGYAAGVAASRARRN